MSLLDGILLGLLQGVTEFLPVSSSGHLVLARTFLGLEPGAGVLFEVFVHLGTGLAILTVFAAEVRPLVASAPSLLAPRLWAGRWAEGGSFRTLVLILLSAVPAGIVGVTLREPVEATFDRVDLVGLCLLGTGVLLLVSRLLPAGHAPVGLTAALGMGLAQALAILPGISRSGSTIVAGLAAGGGRAEIGRFAFLMGLVPMFGAALLKSLELGTNGAPGPAPLLAGTAAAFLSGVLALRALLLVVARGRLAWFAPYCLALGGAAVVLG